MDPSGFGGGARTWGYSDRKMKLHLGMLIENERSLRIHACNSTVEDVDYSNLYERGQVRKERSRAAPLQLKCIYIIDAAP